MSATNSTPNLHLPQFTDSDKPSWLGDVNGAFDKIDRQFVTDESAHATTAAAVLDLQNQVAALTTRVTAAETAATALAARVTALEGV